MKLKSHLLGERDHFGSGSEVHIGETKFDFVDEY